MEQVITQLAVKILFDDYSGYFTREAEIINDIYMTWIRIC